jgi:predicted transcriptional regulator
MNAEGALTDYVMSNKRRNAIYQDLAKEEQSVEGLSRKLRLPEQIVERELDDLRKKRLVKKLKGKFSLTKTGKSVMDKMRVYESPRIGTTAPRNLRRPTRMVGEDNRRDKAKQGT